MMRELDPLKGKQVSDTAICGKTARRSWRMTCNVPLANCCGNCSKASEALPHTRSGPI